VSKTAYIELPLKPEHVEDFADLCNSDEGFALTKKQSGFISAEWMISTSEDGSACFHLWEKWESPEHFGAYLQIPERTEGSKFEAAIMSWAAGELRVCWGEPKAP
jgi:quinol monooxygenase YgiN